MIKHTQTIRQLLPMNCLSVFNHLMELVLKGLMANIADGVPNISSFVVFHKGLLNVIITAIAVERSHIVKHSYATLLSMKTCFYETNN